MHAHKDNTSLLLMHFLTEAFGEDAWLQNTQRKTPPPSGQRARAPEPRARAPEPLCAQQEVRRSVPPNVSPRFKVRGENLQSGCVFLCEEAWESITAPLEAADWLTGGLGWGGQHGRQLHGQAVTV